MKWRKASPGIPLAEAPEWVQELVADEAVKYRQRLGLDADAPLRVVVPDALADPDAPVLLIGEDTFWVADEGAIDLGLEGE